MASTTTLGDLFLKITLQGQKETTSGLNSISKQISNMNNKMKSGTTSGLSFNSMLTKLGGIMAGLSIIGKVGDLVSYLTDKFIDGVKSGFEFNSTMEKLNASMTALTGSTENANALTQEMLELSAESPYNITDIAKASKTLLGYGVAQEDVIETMEMLGNIALGDSYAFDRLAYAYGQTTAKGKVQAEEVRQMVNNGFAPLKFIAEETGYTMAELDSMMRKGNVSVDMLTDAMMSATTGTGLYAGQMEALSATYAGQKEKISEYSAMFWGGLVRPFQTFLAERIFPRIVEHLKNAGSTSEELGQKIFNLGAKAYELIKPFVDIIRVNWRDWLQTGIDYSKKLYDKVLLLYDIFKLVIALFKDFDTFKEVLKALIPEEFQQSASNIYSIFKQIYNVFQNLYQWTQAYVIPVLSQLWDVMQQLGEYLGGVFTSKFEKITDIIANLDWTPVVDSATRLKDAFIQLWEFSKDPLKFLAGLVIATIPVVWGIVEGILSSIPEVLSFCMDAVSLAIDAINFVVALFTLDADSLQEISERMVDTVINAFLDAVTLLANALKGIWENVNGYLTDIGQSASQKLDNLKNKMRTSWENIKTTVLNKASELKRKAIQYIKDMIADIIQKAYDMNPKFGKAVQALIRGAIGKFKELVKIVKDFMKDVKDGVDIKDAMYKAGSNLINSLVSGIKAGYQALRSAVSGASDIVKSFIGWESPTKEGAGKTSDEWIPNLMDMLIKGMDNYKGKLAFASRKLSSTISENLADNTFTNVSSIVDTATPSISTGTSASNLMNVTVKAESYDGESIGRALIQVLNQKGILTHKL